MKVLQINAVANSGSTGRIGEELGKLIISGGMESYFAYGRSSSKSESRLIKIGTDLDFYSHVLLSRMFDRHGFGSSKATRAFISEIEKIRPDLIHLHNVHGYYLNVEIVFNYLRLLNIPLIWTLHDCWPFTGHCSHFDYVNCYKWQTQCHHCPNTHAYPRSWIIDNSRNNFEKKKKLFTGFQKMILVSPSEWLAAHIKNSYLGEYDVRVINNGIDLQKFRPSDRSIARHKFGLTGDQIILGVASTWTIKKGLDDFIELRSKLKPGIDIVLVGVSEKQKKSLPPGIKGISRTESIEDLVAIYSAADAFVNPTYVDNFPTTNIEAQACGTPVITYDTGGSSETVDDQTGIVVEKGNTGALFSAIDEALNYSERFQRAACVERAARLYSSKDRFGDYIKLYQCLSAIN